MLALLQPRFVGRMVATLFFLRLLQQVVAAVTAIAPAPQVEVQVVAGQIVGMAVLEQQIKVMLVETALLIRLAVAVALVGLGLMALRHIPAATAVLVSHLQLLALL